MRDPALLPRAPSHATFAIIPVKPLHRAKSRLARALKASTRATLVRSIFSRTLDVIAQVPRIDGVIVVSRDLTILELARQRSLIALLESDSGLNPAITQASHWALKVAARSVLVIPVDLPLITPDDLNHMIDLALEPDALVIAPDRHCTGTNVLLVRPPNAIRFAYGTASFSTHCRQALEHGLTVHEYRSPTTAFDIDLPDDLERYRALDALIISE